MNKIYFSFLAIIFSSCFPHINYIGNSLPATREPDFYVDEKSIDKPYKVIGKGYPNGVGLLTLKTLQKKAIEKAKKKGADAVLVQDYFVQSAIANSSTIYHTDHNAKGITGNTTFSTGDGVDTQFIILFLKYTE
jgi:hypothetical protein